jgi:putative transposase
MRALILEMARDNPGQGDRRSHGEQAGPGDQLAPLGGRADPQRRGHWPRTPAVRADLAGHSWRPRATTTLAAGFFPAGTVLPRRLHALLPLGHGTRRPPLARITACPTGEMVTQQAPYLVINLRGPGRRPDVPDPDHDATYTAAVGTVFTAPCAPISKTPVRAPRANATAERRIARARPKRPDRMLITSEPHSKPALNEHARPLQHPPAAPGAAAQPARRARTSTRRHDQDARSAPGPGRPPDP